MPPCLEDGTYNYYYDNNESNRTKRTTTVGKSTEYTCDYCDRLSGVTKLRGVVTKHFPFGIFVALSGIKFTGLVQIPDFKDEGHMTPSDYPEVGSSVEAVVLGFKDQGQQIWLGMKPSLMKSLLT